MNTLHINYTKHLKPGETEVKVTKMEQGTAVIVQTSGCYYTTEDFRLIAKALNKAADEEK